MLEIQQGVKRRKYKAKLEAEICVSETSVFVVPEIRCPQTKFCWW